MTLTDTGVLVALLYEKDSNHALCAKAARQLGYEPLITTLPCYTESMYFLQKHVGHKAQQALWNLRRDSKVVIHLNTEPEMNRMESLMRQYRDSPMDFADASLVAAAESLGISHVFTLDRHFHGYRMHGKKIFKVIP